MTYSSIELTSADGIATLTFNRPKALNALNTALLEELAHALNSIKKDEAIRVLILTGAGEKSFIAGADITEIATLTPLAAKKFAQFGQDIIGKLQGLAIPVIAAVNGYALGGGCEMALACDFIYASEKAKFGFPEVGLGVIPGFGGTQNLARLIGPNKAKELVFSGRIISAAKAREWGIVNELFAPEELLSKALETAREIASKGALGVAYAKDAIASGMEMTKEDGFRYEASLFGVLFATGDQREGMGAFLAKRAAEFKGK